MKARWFVLLVAGLVASSAAPAFSKAMLNTARIDELVGSRGVLDKEGVYKITVPRADLSVRARGVRITPPMGLSSWAAFKKLGSGDMVMGDLVLLENQVNPVMSAALDNGLEVTALHNHFFGDVPKVMFMHIGGKGDEDKIAEAVGRVFAKIRETETASADPPDPDIDPATSTLDPKKIDAVFGKSGVMTDGVYKLTFGRTAKMHGETIGADMGVNTWAAFAGSDGQAVVDGDFVMLESELQGVLKALRHSGIDVVAIHQHMTGESPRQIFLHFWAVGSTEDLARGIKSALDTQKGFAKNVKRMSGM